MIRTAGLGAVAAAVAAGRAAGLDGGTLAAAVRLSAAWSLGPASRQPVVDGSLSKRVQPAVATEIGVRLMQLAAAGLDGPAGWLDGQFGLVDESGDLTLLERSGWEVADLSLKPYPACRYAHAAIAAAIELVRECGSGLTADATVRLPRGSGFELVARPFERRGTPIVDAQFSVPWLVAAVFSTGALGLDVLLDPTVGDPRIVELAARITVVQDLAAGRDGMSPAMLEVAGRGGRIEIRDVPGSAAAPLPPEAHRQKVDGCVKVGGLPLDATDQLETFVGSLAELDGGPLYSALRGLAALERQR